MTLLWVQEVAEQFWQSAGEVSSQPPRDLGQAVAFALPLAVVDLPRLRVAAVATWLAGRGAPLPMPTQDRLIRACLVARGGVGFVFLDGADPANERRFSLAHEVAHFLIEDVLPRQRARHALGPEILSVLDGCRPANRAEQIDAVLGGITLHLQTHLMERTADGHPTGARVGTAERHADELALELLAPSEAVRAALGTHPTRETTEALLQTMFGLPATVARSYADQFIPQEDDTPSLSLLHRLGLA